MWLDAKTFPPAARNGEKRFSAEHSGQPLEKVSGDMERDYFLTAEEAKQYGFIDNLIAHRLE